MYDAAATAIHGAGTAARAGVPVQLKLPICNDWSRAMARCVEDGVGGSEKEWELAHAPPRARRLRCGDRDPRADIRGSEAREPSRPVDRDG